MALEQLFNDANAIMIRLGASSYSEAIDMLKKESAAETANFKPEVKDERRIDKTFDG